MIDDRSICIRVQGTHRNHLIEFQHEFTEYELRERRDLDRCRRYFDDTLVRELVRKDLLYGITLGDREARIGRGEFRVDGDWIDDALFPPDQTEALAQDVNRVLADRAREERRKSP